MSNYWLYNITKDHSLLRNVQPLNENIVDGIIEVTNFDEETGTRKGDHVITLNKNGVYYFDYYGEVTGTSQTTITSLTQEESKQFAKRYNSVDKYPKKYLHSFPVTLNIIHEKLEDYLYSLIAIENYAQPQNHFKRKFTHLKKADYETITEKLLYIARTTFGRLFNCLPRDNQFEILLSLMEIEGRNDIRNIGYLKAIKHLKAFIEDCIVDTGNYIISIEKTVTETFSPYGVDINQLGFGLEENLKENNGSDIKNKINTKVDLIQNQAEHFKDLFKLDYDLSLVDELERIIQDNEEIEVRFEKLFNRRRWPLNIVI